MYVKTKVDFVVFRGFSVQSDAGRSSQTLLMTLRTQQQPSSLANASAATDPAANQSAPQFYIVRQPKTKKELIPRY